MREMKYKHKKISRTYKKK